MGKVLAMNPAPDIPPPPIQSHLPPFRFTLFGSRTLLILNELSILFALAMRVLILPRVVAAVEDMGSVLPSATLLYANVPLAIHVLVLGAMGAGMIVKEFLIRDVRWRLGMNMLCGVAVIVYLVGLIFALFLPITAMIESLSQ